MNLMRRTLFVVVGIVVGSTAINIVLENSGNYLPGARYGDDEVRYVNSMDAPTDYGPPPPHNANEWIFQDHRQNLRVWTLRSLEQPWSNFCQAEGRRRLLSSLKEYFYHRGGQESSYPSRWGDVGKAYITHEWSSTDDRRIEKLIQDLYYLGYLDPKALEPTIASRVSEKLKDLPVTGKPCNS